MHFSHAFDHFDGLAAERTAQIVASAADVTLVVDKEGIIRDAAFGVEALFNAGGRSWEGRKWVETVTAECEGKIEEMLSEARAGRDIRPREINHSMPHGEDMPVRYSAARLNDNGNVIVFGRDISRIAALQQKLMNSQLSIEREFARLRSGELRYRMMFELGQVPQMVIDATTLNICDVNPAAQRVLGIDERRVGKIKISQLFDNTNSDVLHKLLRATLDDHSDQDVKIELRSGEGLNISATLFRQERRSFLLLHLTPDAGNVVPITYAAERQMLDLIDNMPDAFVVTNSSRQVLKVNSAFVDLLNLSSPKEALGDTFDVWFERPGVDCNVLLSNVQEHGTVRRFATVLRGRFGRVESVEIAATEIRHGDGKIYGFLIRPVSTVTSSAENDNNAMPRSNEQITNLVGHMPLKDIVRETTHMIEQLCIETALELTGGNRVSAARMLGLSRQSLYAKLARDAEPEE